MSCQVNHLSAPQWLQACKTIFYDIICPGLFCLLQWWSEKHNFTGQGSRKNKKKGNDGWLRWPIGGEPSLLSLFNFPSSIILSFSLRHILSLPPVLFFPLSFSGPSPLSFFLSRVSDDKRYDGERKRKRGRERYRQFIFSGHLAWGSSIIVGIQYTLYDSCLPPRERLKEIELHFNQTERWRYTYSFKWNETKRHITSSTCNGILVVGWWGGCLKQNISVDAWQSRWHVFL